MITLKNYEKWNLSSIQNIERKLKFYISNLKIKEFYFKFTMGYINKINFTLLCIWLVKINVFILLETLLLLWLLRK